MNEKKTYVPKCSAKEVMFESGHSIIKIGFHAATMIEFLKQHANAKGYVNLGISERKEPGQFGDTHTVWLDTWQPQRQAAPTEEQPRLGSAPGPTDDVPF